MCVCVCVRERERERGGGREKEELGGMEKVSGVGRGVGEEGGQRTEGG